MTTITPFLWFDNQLEEAIEFYSGIFPDTKLHGLDRQPDGTAFIADFELAGQRLRGLNGGPQFQFTEAFSLFVECEGQDEVDHYWDALTADGGEESMCGWLKDRYGLSWQIIPVEFTRMMSSGTAEQKGRVFEALMKMRKIDVAALEAAYSA